MCPPHCPAWRRAFCVEIETGNASNGEEPGPFFKARVQSRTVASECGALVAELNSSYERQILVRIVWSRMIARFKRRGGISNVQLVHSECAQISLWNSGKAMIDFTDLFSVIHLVLRVEKKVCNGGE